MAVIEGASQPGNVYSLGGNLIEIGPPVTDRASLESVPGAGTAEFFLLTEAANRAWAAISKRRLLDRRAGRRGENSLS